MDRKWSDGDPSHAAIGDLQYHHFKIQVAQGSGTAVVKLESAPDAELCLALRKDDLAWISDADYVLFDAGGGKTLTIDNLEPGEWYVSVYCPTRIQTINHTSGNVSYYSYLGKTAVLNGVPYTLSVSFGK